MVATLNDDYSAITEIRAIKNTNDFSADDIKGLEEIDAILSAAKEESAKSMLLYIDDSEGIVTVSEFEVYEATTEDDIKSLLK